MTHPAESVPAWDETKQVFVDKSQWGVQQHGFGGGAGSE